MSANSTKEIFVQYFTSQEVLNDVLNYLPLPFFRVGSKRIPTGVRYKPLVSHIRQKTMKLRLDQARFDKLLTTHLNVLAAGRKPSRGLENLVRSYNEDVEREIQAIPNSADKACDSLRALVEVEAFRDADQVYDAMVLLGHKVPPATVAKVVRSWKEEARRHKEEHKDDSFPTTDIFWISRDFMETIDGVSRYRFREHFAFGEFEEVFNEVESMLASALLEGASGIEAMMTQFFGDTHLGPVAYDLWLVSRSRSLPSRIRDAVNLALRRIAGWQSPEGWWTNFRVTDPAGKDSKTELEKSRYLPCTYTTALCSLDLLKLSISEPIRNKGILGVRWLLERQNPDGSWSREHISETGIEAKPDLSVTLLATEAVVRSGLENLEHTVHMGLEWIERQQNELGMWKDEGFPFPFMTVLVLELLGSWDSVASGLDQYSSMSRGFLQRSLQLSLEQNTDSHRLAIIAAFHGVEAFLYSVLTHPSVNIRIFERNGVNTIGMRKALVRLQDHLQEKGEIRRNEVVLYRSSLDRLAYLRDQVVHKGIDVTQSACRPLIDDALKFVAKYSVKILGVDILI
ncbi:hypothetical protein ES702_05992 [subsurface metagenome]